jgi:5-methylcytosine-specific restriction enzyme subunit McrC
MVELTEYETRTFAEGDFSERHARIIYSSYPHQIDIQPPSFLNDRVWRLTSLGWVGYIPLADDLHLSLVPRVPVGNLFRMLEYAYRLDLKVLEGLTESESIVDVYDRLALILAKRALDRIKKGLYRSYVAERRRLPYLRGRLDVESHIRTPHRVTLPCNFEEHTSDLEDNQILLWTLTRILEGGICSERSLAHVRKARRALLCFSSLRPFNGKDCADRLYNRLNQDYEPMHALCRFFVEHTGPTHLAGDHRMLPILVDMDRLFELFVVEWLRQNVPPGFVVHGQEKVQIRMGHIVAISIDITIDDVASGRTIRVVDTKYKAPDQPSASDIEQVVAYAEAKDCNCAALVYPISLEKPVRGKWGRNIFVESLAFPLEGDLERAGQELLGHIMLKYAVRLRSEQ